jgi:hypothetical protein
MSAAGLFGMALWACTPGDVKGDTGGDTSSEETPGDGVEAAGRSCADTLLAFEGYSDLVDVLCTETHLHITTVTGLPDPSPADGRNRIMVGIESWIQRVPIPYGFEWQLPWDPEALDGYVQTTGVGPIAVAVNGVPIFHYEKRPLEDIDPAGYLAGNDTVAQGELDQCGGHAGQAEDYHYHYAPICLLDGHDLDQPIAFSMDGLPIHYGTGGDDFYGGGRYSDWDSLPDGGLAALDECNAYEDAGGNVVYYTTAGPPYVLGCHRAAFDRSVQINVPFGGRPQGTAVPYGTEAGEPVSTLVTSFSVDEDGTRHLVFDALEGEGSSETTFVQTDAENDCWEFGFSQEQGREMTMETYCR